MSSLATASSHLAHSADSPPAALVTPAALLAVAAPGTAAADLSMAASEVDELAGLDRAFP